MDKEMIEMLDSVLAEVRDPDSGLTIGELGVIDRFRYNAEKSELYIFSNFLTNEPNCMTCVALASAVIGIIKRSIADAITARRPDLTVLWV
jgi:metal-sulfur cluster biosynthetic enzyme